MSEFAVLDEIADHGYDSTKHPWPEIRLVMKARFNLTIDLLEDALRSKEVTEHQEVIMHQLDEHQKAPWTVQRLAELICSPRDHYNDVVKYMRAVSKVLEVVSSHEDFVVAPQPRSMEIASQ